MAIQHTTQPGESLLDIAYSRGFRTWRTIWDDDANAELRESRTDPQVLAPGDVVSIPEHPRKPVQACPVDKSHRFRLTRPRAWLNLRMLDDHGEALGGLRYSLRIADTTHEGTTEDDGMLSVEIRPTAHEGKLVIWLDEPDATFEARVQIGHLDPASTLSGARGRLRNLGVECANERGDDLESCPSTRAAIASFQMATAQTMQSGQLDERTSKKLQAAHD